MVSELDVFRTANLLIKRHGETAEITAAMRADELLASGDIVGQRVWLRIVKAIKEIQDRAIRGTVH